MFLQVNRILLLLIYVNFVVKDYLNIVASPSTLTGSLKCLHFIIKIDNR